MKSYEESKDGGPLSIEEDMVNFQNHNVGGLNSGWHADTDSEGGTYYYYINVESVVSDTLILRRNLNIVQAEIPDIYGVGIHLDLSTGILKLLGRDNQELSSLQLQMGAMMTSIEEDKDNHTITFKFTNHDDIVIDIEEIIGNFYTKEEIDAMFEGIKVKTKVIEDRNVEFTILNNSDTSFTNIETATFTIPNDIEHGYSAAMSIRLNINYPEIQFDNQSDFELKFIMNNAVIPSTAIPWAMENQFEILFLCDGVDLKAYIQSIEG